MALGRRLNATGCDRVVGGDDAVVPFVLVVAILSLQLLYLDNELRGLGAHLGLGTPTELNQARYRRRARGRNGASLALRGLYDDLKVVHELEELRVRPLVLAADDAHHHLPHHDADRVDVGLGREGLVEVDLGRTVRVGTTKLPERALLVRVGIEPRQAKVGNLEVPVLVKLLTHTNHTKQYL
mgnify:FL=1